jgi:hypothetical protein
VVGVDLLGRWDFDFVIFIAWILRDNEVQLGFTPRESCSEDKPTSLFLLVIISPSEYIPWKLHPLVSILS